MCRCKNSQKKIETGATGTQNQKGWLETIEKKETKKAHYRLTGSGQPVNFVKTDL